MAEVKQVSGSFPVSSKKKPPPNFSNNGGVTSSSFKHIYDDVFASNSPLHNSRPQVSFMDDDYAEVFGCSKSNNGCWSIPYSSIPIIDLPRDNGVCSRGERVDYGGVFGGIDSDSFGLPDGEELFDQLKKKAKTSSSHTLPSYGSQAQTMEATSPGISNQSYGQLPTNGFCQSLYDTKHFDPRKNESTVNATSRSAKSAHIRANSLHEASTTQKALSSQSSVSTVNGQSPANVFCQSSDNMKQFELGNNEVAVNANRRPRKESHVRAYSLHEASATRKILSSGTPELKDNGQSPANRYCQSSDNMKHFEPENNEMTVNATSGLSKASDVREPSATQKTLSSEKPVIKDDGESPTNGFCQSFDNTKHFEHGNYRISAKAIKGPGNAAAHVRAYSLHDDTSTTQNYLSSQKPVMKDDTLDAESHFRRKQEKHSRHISLDFSANKQNSKGDSSLQKASDMSRSNLVNSSPATCQPSEAATNDLCQSFDNKKNSKYKTNEVRTNNISESSHVAEIHPIHESDDALHTNGPQTTVPSIAPVLNDVTPSGIDAKSVEEKGKCSQNTSMDLGASTQNGVCEAGFHKASGLHESTSIDKSPEAFQTSFEAGPSKVVKDDTEFAAGTNKVKKKGRRSRMTSLDFSDPSDQHDSGGQRKPRFGSSYSFDASNDPCAAHVKVQPSKMYPSSSLPQFFPVESHYKISENSSYKNSQKKMYRDEVGSPPSLAEEFDVNSAAAVSAAALQRAIEEAEIRIRLAKEFLERNRQGCTNMRFKDTLKVKRTVAKENGHASEMKRFKQTKMDESFPPEDTEKQPFSPLEELEQNHSTTSVQVAAAFEDQSKFVKDEEFTERKDGKTSELDREEDKCEGGEWEAAKHLNQIISGVKNRIASFMSWQTETEKKEDLKEIETNIPQQQPEEVERDLEDHEGFKERRAERNQAATTSAGEEMHGGKKVQFAPEAVESEENETVQGFTRKPEKVGNKVDIVPNTAEPSLGKFQFFAFRNQTAFEPLDGEVEKKSGRNESREYETEHEQVQVIKEVKDEHLHCQGEVESPEELDGKSVAQDSNMQDDMYITSNISSSDDRSDKEVEEPSLPGHHEMELSHEGDEQGDMNRKGDVCSANDEIAEMVEDLFSMTVHDNKELDQELNHEEDKQGDMNRKGDECSANDEIAEMVEDLFFVAVHDKKELIHEEDKQDDTSRTSHIGSISEENVEMVEEPCFLVGNDEKVFTDEEDRHVDMCRKGHLSSENEEGDKMVEELYIQTEVKKSNVVHEEDNEKCLYEECGEKLPDHSEERTTAKTDKDDECEVLKEPVKLHENVDMLEEMKVVAETLKSLEATEGVYGCQENEMDEIETNHVEEASGHIYECEEIKSLKTELVEETEEVNAQASCVAPTENGFKQNEDLLSKVEAANRFVESSSTVENVGYPYKESTSSEPEMDIKSPVSVQNASELIREVVVPSPISTESIMEVDTDGIKKGLNDIIENFQPENFVSLDSETDMSFEEKDVDVKVVEPQYQDNSENETDYWHESQENLHVEEFDTATDQDIETSGAEAVHRRRRWFDHRESITSSERPSILEGSQTDLEIDQEILDETELAGSVEIHASKLDCSAAEVLDETELAGGVEIHASKSDCSAAEVASVREAEVSFDQHNSRANVETTPKRRQWFVKRGEEGVPEPLSLFEGVKINLEVPPESKDETLLHKDTISGNCIDPLNSKFGEPLNAVKSDVANNGEKGKQGGDAAPRRKRWFENRESVGPVQQVRIDGDVGLAVEIDQEPKAEGVAMHVKHGSIPISQEKDGAHNIVESKEHSTGKVEVNKREKEKEKEKLAVERAIREARERAFTEARERAKKDAAEKPNPEARQKVAAAAHEKPGKVSSEATSSSDKASVEAKLKAERAAVERATSEARERALLKALSDKSLHRSRELGGKYSTEKNSSLESKYQSSRSSDASSGSDKFEGHDVESTQRRKARLERQKRTTERAAKALDEKNKRDLVAQKEQAAKNMLADALDAEVKRWSTGKEGNLRAMLSTLQYILGPDSGWQPVSLTDLVPATAVRKAYKKATLCVHPDKLQQRGASIQQKHICEKVFDLLKEAWSRFNPDER